MAKSKKKKYTAAQKKAYYRGQGYRAGQRGKKIPYKNETSLKAFRDGYTSVKVTVEKYPNLDSKKN